jgi:succinate dehydrogenase/fumarate reductase flavoprotein subunit
LGPVDKGSKGQADPLLEGVTMTEVNRGEGMVTTQPDFDRNLERLDEDLKIMDRHAAELAEAEIEIRESMRKWDREYKDECLHSVPRPRKHMR